MPRICQSSEQEARSGMVGAEKRYGRCGMHCRPVATPGSSIRGHKRRIHAIQSSTTAFGVLTAPIYDNISRDMC